jgi:hypothetical protein
VADTPAYRGGPWKTIKPEEYDSFDWPKSLDIPLRGIAVSTQFLMQTMAYQVAQDTEFKNIGGCFVAESIDPNDGIIQVVAMPPWLEGYVFASDRPIQGTTGKGGTSPTKVAGSDATGSGGAGTNPASAAIADANSLADAYAHAVYCDNTLRGRVGSFAGKLRFDIAPGSILHIEQRGEQFLKGMDDDLAMTMVGCVTRVTIAINSENPMASTSFQMSYMRRLDPDNKEDRCSVAAHPIFGNAIHGGGKHGAPLVPAYDNLQNPGVNAVLGNPGTENFV